MAGEPTQLQVRFLGTSVQVDADEPVTIGRTPENRVVLPDQRISRHHARAEWSPQGWVVTDLGSTNGFFRGQQRIPQATITGPTSLWFGGADGIPIEFVPIAVPAPTPATEILAPRPAAEPHHGTGRPPAPQTGGYQAPPSSAFQAPAPASQAFHAPAPAPQPFQAPASQAFQAPAPQRQAPVGQPPDPYQPRQQGPSPQAGPQQAGPQAGPTRSSAPSGPVERPAGPRRQARPDLDPSTQAPHLAALANNTGTLSPGDRELIAKLQIERGRGNTTQTIRIGRLPDNDLVVADMLASRYHAVVTISADSAQLQDLGSANGTVLNGRRVRGTVPMRDGDVLTIGNSDFTLTGGQLLRGVVRGPEAAPVSDGVVAQGISLVVEGKKQLLVDVNLGAARGTLTAIVGPSGAGKSTVSKVIAGAVTPTAGRVSFEGRDVHAEFDALRSRIGMVPQDDVLHQKLTVRQALTYAAELRLSADTTKEDRNRAIDGVLEELGLVEHQHTRVEKLSGGQRKRASVAMELLTGPSLLILDEPTSGLDPALDKQVMELLRRLADAGRVVIVVTHSLAYMNLCDQVLLLAPGGKTSFCGPSKDVVRELGTNDWAAIFADVAARPDEAYARYLHNHPPSGPVAPPPAVAAQVHAGPRISIPRQLSTVARRQLRLILADRGYLVFLMLTPVLLGGVTLLVPGDRGFNVVNPRNASEPQMVLILAVIGACFMGASLTARDLVSERGIFHRERAVGLKPTAYLLAKTVVFVGVAAAQAAIMTAILVSGRKMPRPDPANDLTGKTNLIPGFPLELFVDFAILACVSAILGLMISAFARSSEQIMPLLVVVIMVQLVMSGGLFSVFDSPGLSQGSLLFPSRWGFAASASTVDLNNLNPQAKIDPTTGQATSLDGLWDHGTGNWLLSMGVLLAMGAIFWTIARLRIRK